MMTMTRSFANAFATALGSPRDDFPEVLDRLRGRVRRLARRTAVTRSELGRPVPQLADTRLGYHLTLLKKLGAAAKRAADPRHQGLMAVGSFAATALRGATPGGTDPFKQIGELLKARRIRDQLITHATDAGLIKSKADERQYREWWDNLAHGYNWDRVGHVLAVDSAVKEYLDKTSIRGAEGATDKFQRIARAFVQQPGVDGEGPRHHQHEDFWDGLRAHVRSRLKGQGISGSLTTEPQLQRSILRHAFQETDAADMASSKRWGDAMHMTPPRKADQPMAPERYARGREDVFRL